MSSSLRNKRRTKLVTPANSSFSNCVQDHVFSQPVRGSLDNFKPVVYLDEHGRKHGRVSDHLLQRQIESDREKLKKQPQPKVPMSSTLYGIRNPNIVTLVKDVPVDNENEDEEDVPVNDEVKCIEYKKPSNMITSATSRRQTSTTSGKQSVKFDSTLSANMSRLVDSHLTGLDDAYTIGGDEDDEQEELEPTKPVSNPDANSREQSAKSVHSASKIRSTPTDHNHDRSPNSSRESQGTHKPPRVDDINDADEQRKPTNELSSPDIAQRQKQPSTSSEKREERLKSASSRPKTALSTRSRAETEETKSSRPSSSASTSSINTSALLRSDNDQSQNLSDEEPDNQEQGPIQTPVKSERTNSTANDAMDIVEQGPVSPEPIDKLKLRNAKGEYDVSQVMQLKESFQPIITEAASYGHLDVVRQLIESGQSVHTRNILERTPLHEACASGNAQLASALLGSGALIDQRDSQGMTPFHVAASHGSTKCIRVLSEKGCDINAQDNLGRTAAHYSAMHDHVDSLKHLINTNHIDLTITSNDSKLPIHYAAKNGSKNVLDFFFQSKLMIYATDMYGNTIAHEASEYNQLNCIRLIWRKNRSLLESKNHLGRTPMHMAALFGSTSVLHWLLELNIIGIDQADNEGYTMAHLAASRGHGECFSCLLMHDAQLDLYTFERQESVIDVARRSGKGGRIERARSGVIRCRDCDEKFAKEEHEQARARNAVEQLIHTQIQRGYNFSLPANRSPLNTSRQQNRSTT